MSKRFYLSRKGLARLSLSRDQLRDDLQASTKEMGESVKRDNDLRENPEYMQLQTKVSYELPNKISELTRILETHILIEETEAIKGGHFDEVRVGMQVQVEDECGNGREFSILGYEEGNPAAGIISYLTPVASSLIHKGVGDEVELPLNGKNVLYEIISIERSPHLD